MKHQQWEYLSVRFSFIAGSKRQKLAYLTVDGDTFRPEWDENLVGTLAELLSAVGKDGWELVTHATTSAGHYMTFKRPHLSAEEEQNESLVKPL